MWLLMIVVHALAGIGAFTVGIAALQSDRVRRHAWLPAGVMWMVVALVGFMIAAMAAHWADLVAAERIVFSGLVGLGLYMLHRARRAVMLARTSLGHIQDRYIDDIGFVLIALFDGFIIVTALDLGAPGWFVAAAALAAILVGHRGIGHAKRVANATLLTT